MSTFLYNPRMTGEQLKAIRTILGLTQAQFGERLGLHSNSVARLERSEANITDTVAKLAVTLIDDEARKTVLAL